MDCGPTCLRMIAKSYGESYTLPFLREKCYIDKAGVSLKGISEAAELIGLRSLAVKIPTKAKKGVPSLMEAPLPAVLHWNQNHFVVLYKITKSHVWIADPADGKHKLTHAEFEKSWISDNNQGITLLLEPTNWNETYTIASPISGVIQYQSNLHTKSAIQQGELLGYVLPIESNQLRITAEIPVASAGKVEVGQRSIISFDAFPSKEYGVVIDTLDAISQLPIVDDQGERWYIVEYVLDNPIATDYGEAIPVRPGMSVQVEIITESKSLLERVFNQFVELVRNT